MDQYRKSPRAQFHDYDGGDYFITICTLNMIHYFGEIINGTLYLNQIGKFVHNQLSRASIYHPDIQIPVFTVMPNHVHAIVVVLNSSLNLKDMTELQRNPNPTFRANPDEIRHAPKLSRYVNSLKGTVTKYAKTINPSFAWQGRYHDHIIRNNRDGNLISKYISNNVARWGEDCFNKTL